VTMAIKHVLSGVVLVIASAATVSAFAQTPPPATTGTPGAMTGSPGKARPRLKDLDTNHDNMISREEAKGRPRLEKNFDAIDTNKDGQLSRAELKAYRQAHKGERK
jgi:hypothetical protein